MGFNAIIALSRLGAAAVAATECALRQVAPQHQGRCRFPVAADSSRSRRPTSEIRPGRRAAAPAGCPRRPRETRCAAEAGELPRCGQQQRRATARGRAGRRHRDRENFRLVRGDPRHDEADELAAEPQRDGRACCARSAALSNSPSLQPRRNEAACSCASRGASRSVAGSTTRGSPPRQQSDSQRIIDRS